jgi:hypothetical protein
LAKSAVRFAALVALAVLVLPGLALADTTVTFEQPQVSPGDMLTNQYADLGGSGQGVVFGPLPSGAGDSPSNPVVEAVPAGQAQSGSQVANINCAACNEGLGAIPDVTGTFAVQRSHVSAYVGYLSSPNCTSYDSSNSECVASVALKAFDSSGAQIAASSPTQVLEGAGIHTQLSVSTSSAAIVGFEVVAGASDYFKNVAIDDLSFDTPSVAAPPDFTLGTGSSDVRVVQGSSATDTISIGRLGGSAGNIELSASGLPPGVSAQFTPNPAGGTTSTLTLSADPTAPPIYGGDVPITVTGTPQGPGAGSVTHTVTLDVGVLPAFSVGIQGSTNVSLSQCSVALPVQVGRVAGFPGPVSLSVTGLPPGVQAAFTPTQATFPGGVLEQTVTLTVTAPANGLTSLSRTATIHAAAPPFAEQTATFKVGGTCGLQYDPEVLSMQITQGTQLPALPQRDPTNPGAPIPYTSIGQAAAPGTQQALASLAAFKTTVVRVYADLRYGPASGLAVPAVLNGYSYDSSGNLVPLPGSPILPVSTPPGNLVVGLGQRVPDLEDGYAGAYTFVLPSSWERGKIKLEADLLPAQSGPVLAATAGSTARTAALPGQPPTWAPCSSSACQIDSKFAISEIPFLYTFPFTIRPLAMINTNPYDATLPDPDTVFQWARIVTPIPLIVEPYSGTIDIGDQIGKSNSSGAVTVELLDRVRKWVCSHGEPAHGADYGIQHNDIRSAQGTGDCWQDLGTTTHTFAFGNAPEPLVSISHELFHLLGRPHASPGCGAAIGLGGSGTQAAEPWPTDQQGYLQSVGLAPAPPSFGQPYEVIPGPTATAFGGWFDFMSYCDHVSDGDPLTYPQNAWVSVHNWNAILGSFGYAAVARAARSSRATAHAAAQAHASAKDVASLQVTASVSPGGHVTIDDVNPVNTIPQPASSSPYHLIATDSSGHTTVDVPMLASFGHSDDDPPLPILTLDAVVPAAGVTGVGVLSNGMTLATRTKSAHPPAVRIPRLPSFRGPKVAVTWRATDPDRDALDIEIDYSGDGGRAWTPVWMGPNLGRARLPARYLFRSTAARIRVIANDGFQTTTAVSRRFSSPGAPPSVQILLPWPHLRQPNDAPLVLSGQAFDDRSRMLTGRRLRWMLGRRLLGTGAQITVSGLPAGAHRIDLVARDGFGRRGVASIAVQLRASKPLFLKLQAPRSVGRKAKSVRLTVSSSLDATLLVRVGGLRAQRFTVARRTRQLRVHVLPGGKPVSLRLSLSAGGLTRTLVLNVIRPAVK